jgi:hypothetical protein
MASNPSLSRNELAFLDMIINNAKERGVDVAQPLDFIDVLADVIDVVAEVTTVIEGGALEENAPERRAIREAVQKMQETAAQVPVKLSLNQLMKIRQRAAGGAS